MRKIKFSQLKEILTNDNRQAVIRHSGQFGTAILIGENLSQNWQSGDIIVFWQDGEATIAPGDYGTPDVEYDLVIEKVFDAAEAATRTIVIKNEGSPHSEARY